MPSFQEANISFSYCENSLSIFNELCLLIDKLWFSDAIKMKGADASRHGFDLSLSLVLGVINHLLQILQSFNITHIR